MSPGSRDSRGLLLPGPQPPLTHFGVTLLRHTLVTGLRYSFYHLGLPVPDKAPTRIRELRMELDAEALARLLEPVPGGAAIERAMIDPGGADGHRPAPAGATFFHRWRLLMSRRRGLPRLAPIRGNTATELEHGFRLHFSSCLPRLNDALLDEILTATDRRRRRGHGRRIDPTWSPEAAAWMAGRGANTTRLGSLDVFSPSWADEAPEIDRELVPLGARSRGGRGRFRELFREALDRLRPTLASFGRVAHEAGVLSDPADLFFIPFELLSDLTATTKPSWLDGAVLRNRGEYFGLLRAADPATAARWAAAPLHPMP